MRIVIAGTSWLGAEVFKLARRLDVDVAAVVAPLESHLAGAAMSARVTVRPPEATGTVSLAARPDLIIAAHCQWFIPAGARAASRLGCLAWHPSLLPRHRGRDAVEWTIRFKDPVAGGSLYWMDDGADTGPLALQDWCHVLPGDDATTLWRRDLAPMALQLFEQALTTLQAGGELPRIEQTSAAATWEPALKVKPLSARPP
jgi:methionyl-tRNA formyltransferase